MVTVSQEMSVQQKLDTVFGMFSAIRDGILGGMSTHANHSPGWAMVRCQKLLDFIAADEVLLVSGQHHPSGVTVGEVVAYCEVFVKH